MRAGSGSAKKKPELSFTDSLLASVTYTVSVPSGVPERVGLITHALLLPALATLEIPVTIALPPFDVSENAAAVMGPPCAYTTLPLNVAVIQLVLESMAAPYKVSLDTGRYFSRIVFSML